MNMGLTRGIARCFVNLRGLVTFIGVTEFAGTLGLILPALTKILPNLTMWTVGLATIMVLAPGLSLSPTDGQQLERESLSCQRIKVIQIP